jgi:hypothetical protein
MPQQSYILNENPVRISSRTYSLANYPILNTQSIFVNGLLQNVSSTSDYVMEDNLIKFNYDVLITDTVIANYMIEVAGPDDADDYSTYSTTGGRRELIHWCLRKLGAPVIDINLDDDQIEDRIDEALRYFRDYHFDGVERVYLHHQISASTMTLQSPYLLPIDENNKIYGQTSKAEGFIYSKTDDGTVITYKTTNGKYFLPGEIVSIVGTSNTFTILNSSIAITLGNLDTGYIHVGKKVLSITNIIPQQSSTIGGNLGGMFDFQYQFALNNMFNLASTDLVTYDIYKRYISLWEFMFRGQRGLRFNRKTDRVYFDMTNINAGQWIIFETWSALNPSMYKEVYSDEFVREYSCSLLKQQWGQNLKKYSGISLPGGVTLNGQQIYDEATAELQVLRDRVRKEFELPPDFLVG